MRFYKHHIGDYDSATMHLSWDEDMAYSRLLRVCYRLEKPIPLDKAQTYRLVRAETKEQREAVDRVLREFFTPQDDGWHNKRAAREIAQYQRQAGVNRELGKRGGRPRKTDSDNEPEPNRNPNHKPITTNQDKPTSPIPDCPHERIVELYHERLPMLPRVADWSSPRRQGLTRQRWREMAKPNGIGRGYTTVEEGMDFWRQFFEHVGESAFLTGKVDRRDGSRPFVANLEWLLKPTNFMKVIEGHYDR